MRDDSASTDYRHQIVCGAFVSLRAIEQRLNGWLEPRATDIWSADERAHLANAARLAAEAQREVEDLISAEARKVLPMHDRGTYPDDSLGAGIIRIREFCDYLWQMAVSLHAYENELTAAERDEIVRVDALLTQAVAIIGGR